MGSKMRRQAAIAAVLAVLFTLLSTPTASRAATSHTLASPGGVLTTTVTLSDTGILSYAVSAGTQTIFQPSPLGIETSVGSFSSGLVCPTTSRRTWDQTYSLPAGTKPSYRDHGNELVLNCTKGGRSFKVTFRAHDDGVAYRYEVGGTGAVSVTSERSGFKPPTGTGGWAAQWASNYEQDYLYRSASQLNSGTALTFPLLLSINNNAWFTVLSEAGVLQDGSFYPSMVKGRNDGTLGVEKTPDMTVTHSATLPFATPWRAAIIVNNYTGLINSDLIQNLNPSTAAGDYSWVTHGRASWSWFADPESAKSVPLQKQYIDWAASMGFEAHTLDCCYNNDDLPELTAYAKQRGIKLWAWVTAAELGTPEGAEYWTSKLAAAGVAGLKVDFFLKDSQEVTGWYSVIAEAAKRHKLMLLFHGSTKPSGETRTWPWLVSSEAVAGTEHYMYEPKPSARLDATLPFVRGPIGSMDYTPTMISMNSAVFTQAHVLAQAIVLDSALINYSDSDAAYEQYPGRHLMRAIPAVYDETRVVEGFPGDHITMARRSGSSWLVGAFTVDARTSSVPLTFLGSGTYTATIFYDDAYGRLQTRTQQVTSSTVLSQPLIATGGYAAHISAVPLAQLGSGDRRYEAENVTLGGTAKAAPCRGCSAGWSATGLGYGGQITFASVTASVAGPYTLVYTYTGYQDRAFTVSVNGGTPVSTGPIHSGSWESVAKGTLEVNLNAGTNSIVFGNANGWANDLDAIRLERRLPAEVGTREGSATVTSCAQCAGSSGVALGTGGSVTLAGVPAASTGNKTIHIDYASTVASLVRLTADTASVVVSLPPTGGNGLTSLRTTGLPLNSGSNTVRVELLSGAPVIDQIRVTS